MDTNMKKRTREILIALSWALVITVLCGLGVFRSPELWLEDTLYQQPVYVPGDIIVIGITDEDFDEFGPYYSWDRTVYARVLEALASDPDNKPAVVVMDVLFDGETDKEKDSRLASAAGELNVVVATEAKIGTERIFGTASTIYEDDYAVLDYIEPFDELKNATTQGFMNTMYDEDGVIRHSALYLEPGGNRVYSMPYVGAKLYAQQQGFDIEMPPTDARGWFYVPFSAQPGDFYDDISLSDVINGEFKPEFFADKLVVIGPYASGLQDAFITAIDRGRMMYGVEYHANVMQCLLDGRYKREASDFLQLAILFVICFAFFYFCSNRKLRVVVPAFAVLAGLAIGAAMLIYEAGYIIHALWIPVGLLILFVVCVARNYINAAIAKQNVTRTFERYVAPNIVGEILKEGTDALKLGGKTVDIAVLFVDVRGFTTMSERLSPEVVVKILNRYLTMASACVDDTKGTVDKFVGDAMMAFWGAPIDDDDPVYHAAVTALGIVEGAKKISAELKEEIGEELNVGVGINYGPAVVGNMGSEKRMDYTAIGDTVNTSARLEANAPGGTVYISRSCADRLEGRMKFEPLDHPIKLKGKADGFEILKLIGPV